MSASKTMVRTSLAVGDIVFHLAQGYDTDDLKRRVNHAVHAGGGFVDLVVVENRTVSLYLTGIQTVILSVETVPFDERDTGLVTDPFGGLYDPF